MPMEVPVCALCGESRAPMLYRNVRPQRLADRTERFELVRCERCHLVYLSPRPGPDELSAYYQEAFYDTLSTPSPSSRRSRLGRLYRKAMPTAAALRLEGRLKLLRTFGPAGGRLLDVGAGDGEFLAAARALGFEVEGTDFSEESARKVRERLGIHLTVGPIEQVSISGTFEVITLWDVLEHCTQPRQALDRVASLLAPGGLLMVSVPNFAALEARIMGKSWPHLDIPRHLYQFTPQTLSRLMEGAGLPPFCVTSSPPLLMSHLPRLHPLRPLLARLPGVVGSRATGLLDDVTTLGLRPSLAVLGRLNRGPALVACARKA